MNYPIRSNSHQLEEVSFRYFRNLLPENWLAEKVVNDYGVDLKVEIFENKQAVGLELDVQLKASIKNDRKNFVCIRLKTSTYNYLWDRLQVVMLVKFIKIEEEAYWILLGEVPEPNQKQKTFTIQIPKSNKLSNINWIEIRNYVRLVRDKKLKNRRKYLFSELHKL